MKPQGQLKHYNSGYRNEGNPEAIHQTVFGTMNQYTSSSYDNSPNDQYDNIDEFEAENVKRELVRYSYKRYYRRFRSHCEEG